MKSYRSLCAATALVFMVSAVPAVANDPATNYAGFVGVIDFEEAAVGNAEISSFGEVYTTDTEKSCTGNVQDPENENFQTTLRTTINYAGSTLTFKNFGCESSTLQCSGVEGTRRTNNTSMQIQGSNGDVTVVCQFK